jgi:hypothetical protein
MDADKPITSINLVHRKSEKAGVMRAADKARTIAENDALNRIQPSAKPDLFPSHS